jgi:hypothetical protein
MVEKNKMAYTSLSKVNILKIISIVGASFSYNQVSKCIIHRSKYTSSDNFLKKEKHIEKYKTKNSPSAKY